MEEILVYFSLKYQGDFMKILEALQKKRNSNERREKKGIRECWMLLYYNYFGGLSICITRH